MSNTEYQEIIYEVAEPVATITMNRPEALNALTVRMLAEIRHAMGAAEQDERVVGIVLTGAGRGFCPGMDMNALDSMSSGSGQAKDDLSHLHANPGDPELGENFRVAYTYMMSVRKPIIAAINGACAGLGFAIATIADLRVVERFLACHPFSLGRDRGIIKRRTRFGSPRPAWRLVHRGTEKQLRRMQANKESRP